MIDIVDSAEIVCDLLVLCITEQYLFRLPLGASGDEKAPSVSVTGDPAGSIPADTQLFQVFYEGASSYLLQPPLFLLPSSGTQYVAIWAGLSLHSRRSSRVGRYS